MKDSQICQIFLHFSKTFLPQNFSSLSRFGNDADQFFLNLLSLADSDVEVIKIRTALAALQRKANEPISIVLLKIDFLYSALYTMQYPMKDAKEAIEPSCSG